MPVEWAGDICVISGLGYYPNLGTKDAYPLIRRGDVQTAVHLSDAIDGDRLNQGIAAELTWQGTFDVLREQPHIMRHGSRVTLDAQRFAQVGTWAGHLSVDGEEILVTPDRWVGTRDRSWGIRPLGEALPPGRPSDL